MKYLMKILVLSLAVMLISFQPIKDEDPLVGFMTTGSFVYPLISSVESDFLISKYGPSIMSYPLLIINNNVIRDSISVNSFRNNYIESIKKKKYIDQEEAEKLGIKDVPADGVLFVTTKKNHIIDLN